MSEEEYREWGQSVADIVSAFKACAGDEQKLREYQNSIG